MICFFCVLVVGTDKSLLLQVLAELKDMKKEIASLRTVVEKLT